VTKTVWLFKLRDGEHSVELDHGYFSGKRIIRLDGRIIEQAFSRRHLVFDTGSVHSFKINDHECELYIQTDGATFNYQLLVDDIIVEPAIRSSKHDQSSAFFRLLIIPGAICVIVAVGFGMLNPPGTPLFATVPPPWRNIVSCILPAMVALSTAGFVGMVITDIYYSTRMEYLGRWVLLLLSIILFILNALFWARASQGSVGILAAVSLGVPIWVTMMLVLCIVSIMTLIWHSRGVYLVLVPVGFVMFLSSLFVLEKDVVKFASTKLSYDIGANFSPLIGVIYLLLASGMASREVGNVPLNVWYAKFVYLDSYKHFSSLHRLAQQNHLEVLGPGGKVGQVVMVGGIWNGRQILISSNERGLLLKVSSTGLLCPFSLSVNNGSGAGGADDTVIVGELMGAAGKPLRFYLRPTDGDAIGQDSINALQESLALGRWFLRNRTSIWSEGESLCFYRAKIFVMRETDKDIACLLDWMIQICQVMETRGMTSSANVSSDT
jgi:hypothetical protein